MQWYKTGTSSVTRNSTLVTGVNTLWLLQVNAGDIFTLDASTIYEIASVDSNTTITLASPYLGATASSSQYAILRNFTSTTNAVLAAKIAELLNDWQVRENEIAAWQGGTATGGVNSDGMYTLTDALGNAVSVKSIPKMQADTAASQTSAIATATVNVTNYSKNWATMPEDTLVPLIAGGNGTTDYSALNYAAKSAKSATASALSATTATTQATSATASAAAATLKATSATASATTATTQATSALNSATTSTSNAASVSALLASFRSVFLGAFSTDAQANSFATANAITLAAGVMYENTVENKFRIHSGTSWGDYDASAQVSQNAASLSASSAGSSASVATTQATNAAASAATATAKALIAVDKATVATSSEVISTAQANIATTQANIATDGAATATAQAAISTAQAAISTDQAVISTVQAANAAGSAALLASMVAGTTIYGGTYGLVVDGSSDGVVIDGGEY